MANRDHRQKKWWELGINAYQNVIGALSELFQYFDIYYNAETEKRELDMSNEKN